ncbi:MAG: LysR family transcriptional regulator [Ruminococcaceae bacterium]|nr:LysR family transcriptional regulator [Oscillospiraceae bacterium]
MIYLLKFKYILIIAQKYDIIKLEYDYNCYNVKVILMELCAKYAYKVYEKKSFSSAAKALFVSQPALSAAISRLEGELGFKIFDRATVPLSLTPEGRIYIDSLEEIIESETIMKERIKRLSDMNYGKLSVGGSCLAAYQLLAVVCSEFHKKYPNVEVEIDMGNIGTHSYLIERMKKHSIDILVGHKFSAQTYEVTPILEEQYVIAMRKDYKGAEALMQYAITREELITKSYAKEKEVEDMSLFKNIRFLKVSKGSTPAVKIDKLIGDYLPAKCYVKNVRHAGMQYNMMRYGLGAVMTSDTIIKMFSAKADDLVYFVPKDKEAKQMLYMAWDKTLEPTAPSLNFMELAKEICKNEKLFDYN